ncbi:MAG: GDP-mannose 4,6-dehydratase, partial [Verrucomicrobiae bacterium]|nr:GDP-mannose 4,6-dehydratase [Verrucomicrobiae bacterium]
QRLMADPRRFRCALITGIAGSGGSYLAEYIVHHHPEVAVHGLCRWHSTSGNQNLAAVADRVHVHEADLMDLGSVLSVVQRVKPDVIFHLASHANVRASFVEPVAVLQNNVIGTANLLEAVRLAGLDPIIQLCSTSEVYGQVDPKDVPIREDCPLRPASPYAVSKVAQDLLGYSYFVSYKLRVIRTRMFAYLNPRRTDLFATSFARQVAWIEAGLQNTPLRHGNLDSVRTLIDVRDAMRAYWDAVVWCEPGEVYNIGGTTTMTVGDFLRRLVALARVPIPTEPDPALFRPADVTLQIPDVGKFVKTTGWKPRYSFEESLVGLLNYWRQEASVLATRQNMQVESWTSRT